MTTSLAPKTAKPIELVLGAGGVKGFSHIGLLKGLEDLQVDVGLITGVSVGSIVAAFYTSGYAPERIRGIFQESLASRFDPAILTRCMSLPDPVSLSIAGSFLNLYGAIEHMISRYQLRPNANLRIVACDYFKQEPVVFEGDDYDLALAISASCSLPGIFVPQVHKGKYLVDGAWYHYNPVDFCDGTAIVGKFSPVTEYPRSYQLPIDIYFHMREMFAPIAKHSRYVNPEKHVVVESGLPDIAGLNFGISADQCRELVKNGYETTLAALALDQNKSRVPKRGA